MRFLGIKFVIVNLKILLYNFFNMSTKKIALSASTVSFITMLSRILGYVRDAISAALLGVGFVSDAFFVAFRIPNMLRNLLAEGALSSAFVPVFTEYLEKKDKKDVWLLVANVLTVLSIILILITFLGILFAPFIVKIIAPGFIKDAQKFELTVNLTKWLFPFIFLISIAALFMGILNSLKKFSIPAFAPVVLNISMILSGFFICPLLGTTPEKQVYGWIIGILVGAILEIIIQWIPAIKEGFRLKFFIDLYDYGLKKIGKLMLPATLAQSVTQINILVNTILASFLVQGSVTYLYYGNRLMQLPLGVFGVALATVSFPYISAYAANKDYKSEILYEIKNKKIKNILALRGDLPDGEKSPFFDFKYAVDLIRFIKSNNDWDFCIGVAGYPEKHPEAKSMKEDIIHLKEKVDAGADFIITQLFLNNDYFYKFLDNCKSYGINVPVIPGVMTATKIVHIENMAKKCGVEIPETFRKATINSDPQCDICEETIEYTAKQIDDLINNGIKSIHLYTMNKVEQNKRIYYKSLLNKIRK